MSDEPPFLQDVLFFLTGSQTVPPIGFDDCSPSIRFTDVTGLPCVSTCVLSLTFSRSMATHTDETFAEAMNLAILGCQGFGKV